MDAKYYCDTMQAELTGLKARVYDIIKAVEGMPPKSKESLTPKIPEFHALVNDLTKKIDSLKMECPADWSSAKNDIESTKQKLVEQINVWDAEHIPGGYVGG